MLGWTLEVRGPEGPTAHHPSRSHVACSKAVGNTGFGDNACLNMLEPTDTTVPLLVPTGHVCEKEIARCRTCSCKLQPLQEIT